MCHDGHSRLPTNNIMMSIARVAAGNALYWLVALAVAHYSLRRRRSHALPRDGEDSMGDDEVDNDALTKLAIWIFSDGAALCSICTPVEPDEPSEEEMLDFVSRLHQHASGERDPTDRNALQKELCPFDGLYFFAEFPTNESCETDRVREHFHLLGERLGPRLFALAMKEHHQRHQGREAATKSAGEGLTHADRATRRWQQRAHHSGEAGTVDGGRWCSAQCNSSFPCCS